MSDDKIGMEDAMLLAAECCFYSAQLAYDSIAASFDVASRALTEARRNYDSARCISAGGVTGQEPK